MAVSTKPREQLSLLNFVYKLITRIRRYPEVFPECCDGGKNQERGI